MDGDDRRHLTTKQAANSPQARARAVAGLLAASAGQIEAARELTPDVLAAMHEARLFRVMLPRALGGDEADPATFAEVTEILAAADASAAWCVGQGGGCAMSAAYLAPDAAQRLFGAPNAVLAWGAGIAGKAVAVPGGYRVTGTWTFASGSRHATILGGHSFVVEADGSPRLRADGRPADRTALFARSKAMIHDVWHVVGLKGTGSDTFEVRDLFVPEDETIDREAPEELQVRTAAYRMNSGQAYSAAFGGLMLGIARGMLGDLTTLATTKTPRGASSSMRESPVFQSQIARLEARLRSARMYHLGTLRNAWAEVRATDALSLDRRAEIRLAATHAISEGVEIVVEAYRAAGQTAIFLDNAFERRLRDALSASQQAQGRPTHYTTVGRLLLGLPADTLMFM